MTIVADAPLVDAMSSEMLMRSAISGRTYRIRIWEPGVTTAAAAPAPTLFVLDGEVDAGMAAALAGALQPGGGRSVRVVSIAASDDVREPTYKRIKAAGLPREFLHRPLTVAWADAPFPAGDGAKLQRFLIDEVKPMIARRYAGSGRSALFGDGIAGTFVLTVAAQRPGAFDLYAADRPWLDDATARAIADGVRKASRNVLASKLLLNMSSAPHLFKILEPRIGVAFVASGHRAEQRENLTREDFLVETMTTLGLSQPEASK